ncbi:MAG: VTT domain-containing protein [Desulfobacteraceae bacterium]
MNHDHRWEGTVASRCLRPELSKQINMIQNQCINCPQCMAQCAFLKQYGTPKTIADAYDPLDNHCLTLAFQCSLCDLCAAVCPVNLTPGALFLEMRREAVDRNAAPLPEHNAMQAYEKRGTSKFFSWYGLSTDCDVVFFPGCTFSGTRMDTTIALYEHLKTHVPGMGIVLDCCCKPSHDLGRDDLFHDMFGEMQSWLVDQGVKSVIVVCPNCYKVLKTYGAPLEVMSIYTFLAKNGLPYPDWKSADDKTDKSVISIHDPCVLRNEGDIQDAVRTLVGIRGFSVAEMSHVRGKTLCCGEGGSVGFVASGLSSTWGKMRQKEAGDRRLLTYCAGCAASLDKITPTDHILDLVFYPEAVADGTRKTSRAPWTYLNRIRLKRYLQKNHPAAVSRERDYLPETASSKPRVGKAKKIILLSLILATIAGIRFSGISEYFDSESLRQGVASLGSLAPLAYILLYSIAPSLFLPGLPITLVGGILFGPFWGVVYSITGATVGASIAFLIARYLARDWIQAKLIGPRWKELDLNVEKNGWKIVAFTRLVPLFPFNLLNYAFGLTPIKFFPFVIASFFCMLPACIAFIVFSSSLVDLLKGNISPGLIIGILLIALVSLIPVIIRKFKR